VIGLVTTTASGRAAAARLAAVLPDTQEYDVRGIEDAFLECDTVVSFLATGATGPAARAAAAGQGRRPRRRSSSTRRSASPWRSSAVTGRRERARPPRRRGPRRHGGRDHRDDAVGLPGLDTLGWPVEGAVAAVSRAMLDGTRAAWLPTRPGRCRRCPSVPTGEHVLRVTDRVAAADDRTCVLRPPSLVLGLGASRGVGADEVLALVDGALAPPGCRQPAWRPVGTADARPTRRARSRPAPAGAGPDDLPAERLCRRRRAEPQRAAAQGARHAERRGGRRAAARRRAGRREEQERDGHRGRRPAPAARTGWRWWARSRRPRPADAAGAGRAAAGPRCGWGSTSTSTRCATSPAPAPGCSSPASARRRSAPTARSPRRAGARRSRCSARRRRRLRHGQPRPRGRRRRHRRRGRAGVTAALAASSLLGAPLGHDHASISLSDLHTPWPAIEARVRAVAEADLVVTFYNPRSRAATGSCRGPSSCCSSTGRRARPSASSPTRPGRRSGRAHDARRARLRVRDDARVRRRGLLAEHGRRRAHGHAPRLPVGVPVSSR
jgi:cobalt-precorrin 5A hydrolase/precorrin-3B C17-methyltransferase